MWVFNQFRISITYITFLYGVKWGRGVQICGKTYNLSNLCIYTKKGIQTFLPLEFSLTCTFLTADVFGHILYL